MFKVGDVVRVLSGRFENHTGMVHRVIESGLWQSYEVISYEDGTLTFHEHEIQLMSTAMTTAAKPGFDHLTHERIRQTGREYCDRFMTEHIEHLMAHKIDATGLHNTLHCAFEAGYKQALKDLGY
jgi:hypothetical protein